MRRLVASVAAVVLMLVLAISPAFASARHVAHLEITVQPGQSYPYAITLTRKEILTESWSATGSVYFTVVDPDSEIVRSVNGTSGHVIVEADEPGNYVLIWDNNGNQPATIVSDSAFSEEARAPLTVAILAVIIALIAVVLAILALVLGEHKK